MVSRQQKEHATQYLCDRLEESGLYFISSRNAQGVVVQEKESPHPSCIEIAVANFYPSTDAFLQHAQTRRQEGVYLAPILYKDGKTAFVRMVERNRSWREDKSLKNYSPEQINQMLHLRKVEKELRERYQTYLTYYQPETERLPECFRTFALVKVELDYRHLREGDDGFGFAENHESIDYKLPVEKNRFNSPLIHLRQRPFTVKLEAGGIQESLCPLFLEEQRTTNQEKLDPLAERIAIMLDSLPEMERARLTKLFGKEALGGYASER